MSSGLVMLACPGRSTNIIFNALEREFGVDRVILERPVSRKQLMQRRAQRMGYKKVASQLLFRSLVVPQLSRAAEPRVQEILQSEGLSDAPVPEDRAVRVESVNSEACKALLRASAPKVVVINGTRIIKKEVLECVSARFINTHVGITPTYRGVHGGYWALAERDLEGCGVTVYCVDPGIDTGPVIGQARIYPTAEDNFVTYPILQLAAGLPLARRAVQNALEGKVKTTPHPARPSRLWSHPTLGEYLRNWLLLGVK